MKPVLQLLVNEDGSAFSWVFEPSVNEKVLPPFMYCAAIMQLQSMAQSMLAAKSVAPPQSHGVVEPATKELLNRLPKNGKGGA